MPFQHQATPAKMRAAIALLALATIGTMIKDEEPPPRRSLRAEADDSTDPAGGDVFIPRSMTVDSQRALMSMSVDSQRELSLNLGGGKCKWQPPVYDVPAEVDFQKTLIAGFPSGDKRMIFVQMEALTGWPAKDEWDFEFLGDSNHPFIKANYPHHEGIWGWGTNADQVVMMIRNIRRSMVEYHDILWDIGYAKTWEEASLNLDQLYGARPPMEDFLAWRDLRVIDEVHWYGWFIDYYMEGGLMRDMFTHKITTPEHWNMLMMPTVYTKAELDYDLVVGPDTVVDPSYDPHCLTDVTGGCEPVAVISAEKLRDYTEGPNETAAIANVLLNDDRTGQFVIAQEAWDCVWAELIQNGKGLKTVYDRPGFTETDYNFSAEMLQEMLTELTRLIDKYSGWEEDTAKRVVDLLTEHRALIQIEFNEVNAGTRKLGDNDFLGPAERERRKNAALEERGDVEMPIHDEDYFSEYFRMLEAKILEKKRRKFRKLAREQVRAMRQYKAMEKQILEEKIQRMNVLERERMDAEEEFRAEQESLERKRRDRMRRLNRQGKRKTEALQPGMLDEEAVEGKTP